MMICWMQIFLLIDWLLGWLVEIRNQEHELEENNLKKNN